MKYVYKIFILIFCKESSTKSLMYYFFYKSYQLISTEKNKDAMLILLGKGKSSILYTSTYLIISPVSAKPRPCIGGLTVFIYFHCGLKLKSRIVSKWSLLQPNRADANIFESWILSSLI